MWDRCNTVEHFPAHNFYLLFLRMKGISPLPLYNIIPSASFLSGAAIPGVSSDQFGCLFHVYLYIYPVYRNSNMLRKQIQ